jgi:hypothetical protein
MDIGIVTCRDEWWIELAQNSVQYRIMAVTMSSDTPMLAE